ncbi:MAG: glycosyltransferase [Anaerolineales bacterium]|nr:glycosyltransferase [Chloroflexota bacterium]MBL6979861.1 glycosyltransferase [Anaerolineales bacterium]
MRVGQNPAKFIQEVPQPARVTVATVVYIPLLSGYFEQSLDVLKICLNSIWDHTDESYDLMVFDNASCPEVRQYLLKMQEKGKIQYLLLSEENIGKAGAWNVIFGAAPGEVIAYADSDVYYYPGWLTAQLDVLEKFPNVGMVTGIPMWSPAEFSTSTVQWAVNNPDAEIERGEFLTWEEHWRHARSLGGDEQKVREFFADVEDIRLTYQGEHYYVGAGHFQFVGFKRAFQSVLPIPNERPMGQVRLLDVAINEKGYLRLSTPEWWVQHLGNRLSENGFNARGALTNLKGRERNRPRILHWQLAEDFLYWIYHRIFEFLHR